MARKKIPEHVLTELFTKSMRRCSLCYGLNNSFSEMDGQVAHLDQDSSNDSFDNLVWLCLSHHNRFDSRTSQSKNYTKHEVKSYRKSLYEKVDDLKLNNESNKIDISDKLPIENGLNAIFEHIPYTHLLMFIDGFPEYFSLELSGPLDVWKIFKKSNPHLYPFRDITLNKKLDDFFFCQRRVECLICAQINNKNCFDSIVDYNGTDHKLKISPDLTYEESVDLIRESNNVKITYEKSYKELTDYVRANYPDVKLNSYKKLI